MHTLAIAAIVVTLNGAPVHDADVCAFKAAATDTPFHEQLASNDVVCSAPMPAGLWNLFAKRGTELVSNRVVFVDARRAQPEIELRLEPAATLTMRGERHAFAYVTETLSAYPANADGVALVPANRELVPVIADDANPVAIGDVVRLEPHETRTVTIDRTTRSLATWVAISPADEDTLRTARRPQPPRVSANSRMAINPLRGSITMNGAMQFIRDVPKGNAIVELSGATWKHQTISLHVPDSGVAVSSAPLPLVPASAAIVRWSAPRTLRDLASSAGVPCKPQKDRPPEKPAVSLLSCRGVQNERSLPLLDRTLCKVIGTRDWPADATNGEAEFESVEPGAYVAEFGFGSLPPVRETVRLKRFERETVTLDAGYSTLYGRVTFGGERLSSRAQLKFRFAYDAFTDDDGNYTVVMPRPLAAGSVIAVQTCDGVTRGEHIIDEDVSPNARLDIDLPNNSIAVQAVDKDNGAPIAGALVRYGAFRRGEMSSLYYFRFASSDDNTIVSRTDAEGRYTIRSIPADKTLRVCLEHEEYDRTCADTFKMTSTQQKTLRIEMERKDEFSGRIAGVSDVVAGQIYWFSADGNERERASVKSDGTFHFNYEHALDEAVVFVSANHPLFAFPQPPMVEGEPMIVNMPAALVRTFTIAIGDTNSQHDAIASIAIGNLIVPYPPFAQHLALHGSQLDMRDRGPLVVPDILETAPISAILGPPLAEVTPPMRAIDLFRLPQYRGLPRKPVPGDGRVVF